MNPIWLLSTRGRPEACQEVLDACEQTGMTSPGVVYVDETIDLYRNLRLPDNWTVRLDPEWGSLQQSMSWVLNTYPDATRYGWLADDTVPRTKGWDRKLEAAATDHGFAHCRDLWHSEDPVNEWEYIRGDDMSTGLCWGGQLVRTVGWWALPGVRQAGIDTAWTALIGPLGLVRYLPDVIVEHKHYRAGKRDQDQGDSWVRDGINYVQADIDARDRWVASPDFMDTLRRVVATIEVSPDRQRLHQLLVDAKAGQLPPGMPAARLQNIIEEYDVEVGDLVTKVLRAHTHAQPSPLS